MPGTSCQSRCRSHPGDGGHQVLAELLAAMVLRAAAEAAAGPEAAATRAGLAAWPAGSRLDRRPSSRADGAAGQASALPPPMVPSLVESETRLCSIQVWGPAIPELWPLPDAAERGDEAIARGQAAAARLPVPPHAACAAAHPHLLPSLPSALRPPFHRQEDFKAAVEPSEGFVYGPERPQADTFVAQVSAVPSRRGLPEEHTRAKCRHCSGGGA